MPDGCMDPAAEIAALLGQWAELSREQLAKLESGDFGSVEDFASQCDFLLRRLAKVREQASEAGMDADQAAEIASLGAAAIDLHGSCSEAIEQHMRKLAERLGHLSAAKAGMSASRRQSPGTSRFIDSGA